MQQINERNHHQISDQFPFCIRNRIKFLSEYIAADHHEKVTTECSERCTEIVKFWNQEDIQQNGNHSATESNKGAIHILISEFIPNAEIVINTKKNISHCKNGNNIHSISPFF